MNLKPEELIREAMRANPEEGIKELRKSSESTTKCCCAVQTTNEWYKLLEKVSWMKEVIEAAFDNDTSRIERAHNLHVADKEGRVTILPCRGDADIVLMRDGVAFKPDHWNIHLTTFAENHPTPSGKKVALFDLREVRELMEGMNE